MTIRSWVMRYNGSHWLPLDIRDVVTYTNFCDHRLTGFLDGGGGGRSNFPLSHRFSSWPLQHSRYHASMWYTQLLAPSTVTTSGRPHSICRLCRPIDHLLPHLYKPNLTTIQTVVSKRKVGPGGARLTGPLSPCGGGKHASEILYLRHIITDE